MLASRKTRGMNFPNFTDVDPRTLTGPAAVAVEALARERLAEWWNRADRDCQYPATDDDAVALCRAVEYAIDREALVRFIDVGAFDGVSVTDRQRKWSATDITRLACFLECRRAWRHGSELHRAKKTAYELALENFRVTGEAHELFNDLERFDLRALLLMLLESDSRQQREALFVAIQIKLESFDLTL